MGFNQRIKKSTCRECGTQLDGASEVTGLERKPKSGDVSVCFMCGCLSMFDKDMDLVEIPEDIVEMIRDEPETWEEIQIAIKEIKRIRND